MNARFWVSKEDAQFALISFMLARSYEKVSAMLGMLEEQEQRRIMCGPAGLAGGKEKLMFGPAGLAGGKEKLMFGPAGLAGGKEKLMCGPAGLTDNHTQIDEPCEELDIGKTAAFRRPDVVPNPQISDGQPPKDAKFRKQSARAVKEYEISVKLAKIVELVIRVKPVS